MSKLLLSKEQKLEIRKRIFLHLDGWVLIPVMSILHQKKILHKLQRESEVNFEDLIKGPNINEGYLNVALRILASQGYLKRTVNNKNNTIKLELTQSGRKAIQLAHHYRFFNELIVNLSLRPKNVFIEENTKKIKSTIEYLEKFKQSTNGEVSSRMAIHMEGVLLGAILVNLGINNKIDSLEKELDASSLDLKEDSFYIFGKLLEIAQFSNANSKKLTLNNKGQYYLKRSSSYGVTISYLPTLSNLEELIFGNPEFLWKKDSHGHESHVYRYMNVWGSGGAHKTYFKKIDAIIIDLFNKPLAQQPLGIIDVGCGDGSLLIHLYQLIKEKTLRGKHLNTNPLFIVGADYNKKAQTASQENLKKANIPAEVIFGDISNPKSIDELLTIKYGIGLAELLNVRTFLDHNRIYSQPEVVNTMCESDGAFCYKTKRIPNNALFQNLSNHFKEWAPYLTKYGLLLVELHSLPTTIAAKNIGNTLATPYDATHGFSDQYIIELPCFLKAVNEAGLESMPQHLFQIPDPVKPTISIQLLRTKPIAQS